MKITCPNCSGENNIEVVEYEFLTCQFCKNSLYIDFDGISSTYTYKSIISPEEVLMFLKKDFGKIGFSENYRVINKNAVYIPFWEIEGSEFLESASSKLEIGKIPKPSIEKRVFDFSGDNSSVEKVDPDTQPDKDGKRTLYFMPYYRIVINFKEKEYSFYVDALNGRVTGEPIPFISAKELGNYFPFFIIMFLTFFIINIFFDNAIVSIFINAVLVFLFYNISLSEVVKKLKKNEG